MRTIATFLCLCFLLVNAIQGEMKITYSETLWQDTVPFELKLQNQSLTMPDTFTAIKSISAGKNVDAGQSMGDFIIQSGGHGTLGAGVDIKLESGFTVHSGGSLTASIIDSYERRRQTLIHRATAPFVQDHCHDTVTALDNRSFDTINNLNGPKLLDHPQGWSVEARTGGRPFLCFDASVLPTVLGLLILFFLVPAAAASPKVNWMPISMRVRQ